MSGIVVSALDTNNNRSSAYDDGLCSVPSLVMPWIWLFLIAMARGSIVSTKRRGLRGHP